MRALSTEYKIQVDDLASSVSKERASKVAFFLTNFGSKIDDKKIDHAFHLPLPTKEGEIETMLNSVVDAIPSSIRVAFFHNSIHGRKEDQKLKLDIKDGKSILVLPDELWPPLIRLREKDIKVALQLHCCYGHNFNSILSSASMATTINVEVQVSGHCLIFQKASTFFEGLSVVNPEANLESEFLKFHKQYAKTVGVSKYIWQQNGENIEEGRTDFVDLYCGAKKGAEAEKEINKRNVQEVLTGEFMNALREHHTQRALKCEYNSFFGFSYRHSKME